MSDEAWRQLAIIIVAAIGAFTSALSAYWSKGAKTQSTNNSDELEKVKQQVNGHLDARIAEARRQQDPQILIIDDDSNDLLLSRITLEGFGCQVFETNSLGTAKALICSRRGSARGLPFDIIFLDLRIPGSEIKDYLEMFKQEAPRVAVVILTGHPEAPELKDALATPRMVLVKPLRDTDVKYLLDLLQVPYYKHPLTV